MEALLTRDRLWEGKERRVGGREEVVMREAGGGEKELEEEEGDVEREDETGYNETA